MRKRKILDIIAICTLSLCMIMGFVSMLVPSNGAKIIIGAVSGSIGIISVIYLMFRARIG